MTRTRVLGSTDNRLASALPAEPPPTMMKSYLGGATARAASSVQTSTVERRRVGRGPAAVSLPGSGPLAPRPGSSPAAEGLAADGEPVATDRRAGTDAGEEDHRREARAWQRQAPVELGVAIGDGERDRFGIDPNGAVADDGDAALWDGVLAGVGAREEDQVLDLHVESAIGEQLRAAVICGPRRTGAVDA